MKKKDSSKKGMQGSSNTASGVRSEIKRLQKCMTNAQIGSRVKRSGGTISSIANGGIKRPPASLLTSLKKIPSCK